MGTKRILIIKLGSLGDVVQAEGVYRDLRLHHGDSEIIAMTTPPYRPFFERCPWVDGVLIDHRRPRWNILEMMRLRNRLRAQAIDMVYDFQQVKRTRFYHRYFMPEVPWMGKAPGCTYYFDNMPGTCALEQFDHQLQCLNIATDHVLKPDLSWMVKDMSSFVDDSGVSHPYAVLIPGASTGHEKKRWPYYNQLAERLRTVGITPVIVPGPDEMDIQHGFPAAAVLSGEERYLDYFELAGVLRDAVFAVGNDTGPIHIAAHLHLPGIVLFSDHTEPRLTGLQHSHLQFLQVTNLQHLPLETVWQEITEHLLTSQ
ncbi:MAG: glycosyltransferase family 9 protein [Desulfofustis sp.]